MKDVKPVKEPRAEEVTGTEPAAVPVEDDDSWKDKIELAGVECCYDGVELSTPPFPFVQRWDPQQRGNSKKGRKSKKRKRNCQSYYEEEYPNPGPPSKAARQEDYDANAEQPQFDSAAFENDQAQQHQAKPHEESFMPFAQDQPYQGQEDPHDQSFKDSLAANEQLMRETSESAAHAVAVAREGPDLPELPSDTTSCYLLKPSDCSVGAIIAFKRFEMSASTNWQPRITDYVTAKVDDSNEDGALHVTLARRDQPQHEAQYNQETGEREYGKFEMPGYDEGDADQDHSKLDIFFNELIEPLVIRAADQDPSGSEEKQAAGPSESEDQQDETHVGDEAQRASLGIQAPVSFDGTMDNPTHSEAEPAVPTEEARQQIMEMIRDAGWRSSLGADVGKGFRCQWRRSTICHKRPTRRNSIIFPISHFPST